MEKIPEVRGFGQWDISESGPGAGQRGSTQYDLQQ